MGIRFTPSGDGIERATLRLSVRLTADEIETAKRLARESGATWRQWLESHAALGIEEGMMEEDGNYLQRWGKGDA